MTYIRQILRERFSSAITKAFGAEFANVDPLIQAVNPPHFGDYQANFAMALAKQLKSKPQEIAKQVLDHFEKTDLCDELQISGPGFINFSLANSFLQNELQSLTKDKRLGVAETQAETPTIVEYGSPNVAKEMHVGHLRSTIIGDAIARVLSFLGHKVIRQNHVGDWGTQFGMLIQYLIETNTELGHDHSIQVAAELYKKAKQRFDQDPEFANRSRTQVVALQSGDAKATAIWQRLVIESEKHFQEVYNRLGVLLTNDDIRSESFYNPMLADIVRELKDKGIATISESAVTIFLPGFVNPENLPVPFIIQKSDGGYLYATTDLAAAKFRIEQLKAKRLIYVVDARQAQHFAMLFAALHAAGWASDEIRLEHVAFGTVLGKDRKPFKTRSGESIQLTALLDEAERRAYEVIAEKSELSLELRKNIAARVGIGALKYADLSSDRVKDYVFDWDRMLAFEGNTAPYLQNAYVRIQSIFRKGNLNPAELKQQRIHITHPIEHSLAIRLLEFPEIVELVADELAPHRLCSYLFELAASYHKFYESCPVLSADDETVRNSRLLLSDLTAKTLKLGLGLLGIEVLEQM